MSYSFNQAEKNSIRPITEAQRPGKGGTDFQSWALVHWCLRHRLQFILPGHLPHHNPLCAHSYYEKITQLSPGSGIHSRGERERMHFGCQLLRMLCSQGHMSGNCDSEGFCQAMQGWVPRKTYRTLLEFDEPGSHVKIPVPSGIFTIRVYILSINLI